MRTTELLSHVIQDGCAHMHAGPRSQHACQGRTQASKHQDDALHHLAGCDHSTRCQRWRMHADGACSMHAASAQAVHDLHMPCVCKAVFGFAMALAAVPYCSPAIPLRALCTSCRPGASCSNVSISVTWLCTCTLRLLGESIWLAWMQGVAMTNSIGDEACGCHTSSISTLQCRHGGHHVVKRRLCSCVQLGHSARPGRLVPQGTAQERLVAVGRLLQPLRHVLAVVVMQSCQLGHLLSVYDQGMLAVCCSKLHIPLGRQHTAADAH